MHSDGAHVREDFLKSQKAVDELFMPEPDGPTSNSSHKVNLFCTRCHREWSRDTLRASDSLHTNMWLGCECGERSILYTRAGAYDEPVIESAYLDDDGYVIWEEVGTDPDTLTSTIYGYVLPKNVGFIVRNLLDYEDHTVTMVDGDVMDMNEYFQFRDIGV
jgi:hypothetical protein